ncbi:MAG: hypothetical protein IPI17_02915 [Nitrosomonas sp.]|nr:hypothetical protein [Nitrosomonas sp.]
MSYVVYAAPATEPVSVAEVLQHCRIDASNQEPAPGVITVALGAGAGNVDNGAHRYLCTFVTADGETQAGDISAAVTVADKTVNGKASLSAIPIGGSLVTARKIYRTAAAGTAYLLLATLADNTTTTYTDNTADSSLGAEAPSTNTTVDPELRLLIAAMSRKAESILKRYLITQTVDLYLDRFPPWEYCYRRCNRSQLLRTLIRLGLSKLYHLACIWLMQQHPGAYNASVQRNMASSARAE